MTTRAADDFQLIAKRLAEIEAETTQRLNTPTTPEPAAAKEANDWVKDWTSYPPSNYSVSLKPL